MSLIKFNVSLNIVNHTRTHPLTISVSYFHRLQSVDGVNFTLQLDQHWLAYLDFGDDIALISERQINLEEKTDSESAIIEQINSVLKSAANKTERNDGAWRPTITIALFASETQRGKGKNKVYWKSSNDDARIYSYMDRPDENDQVMRWACMNSLRQTETVRRRR